MINVKAHLWRKANGHMYSPEVCKQAGSMNIDCQGEACGRTEITVHLRGKRHRGTFSRWMSGWMSVQGWRRQCSVWMKGSEVLAAKADRQHLMWSACTTALTTQPEPWSLKQNFRIKEDTHSRMVQCLVQKTENMQMRPYLCVQVLTTLRWHSVWTELWEQWLILAAWSLQRGTRSCCRVSIGWSVGYSDPLDRVGDCTTHKVSIWGDRGKSKF